MAEAAILTKAKAALRISGTAHDANITDLISACKLDLAESGVLNIDDTDALTIQAILLYCKANFGYDNPDSDRFGAEYEKLKIKLGLAQTYCAYKVTFTVTASATAVEGAEIAIDDDDNTVLITNSHGVAIYYVDKICDVDYTVVKSGYTTITSSVYVAANAAVAVVLT